jgi:branched-chain amino acid transport system permease protein
MGVTVDGRGADVQRLLDPLASARPQRRRPRDVADRLGAQIATMAIPLALIAVQLVFFGLPLGAWIRGVVIGLLTALLAIGMALVYRANRVLNFAQADLGFIPTSLVVGLIVFSGWPYFAGLGIGLVAALVLGAVVELAIVRRFARSPRLVLTVATLGITQVLAFFSVLIPRLWDESAASQRIAPPVDWSWEIGSFVLSASDLIAMIVAPLAMVAVALFLGRTRLGVAVRAAAERSERASLLGIPVGWLSTIVWSLAAALSFLALFLRAGILGVPLGSALSIGTLVQALAALVIGRLRNLPLVALTAVSLGLLEYGVAWNASSPLLVTPIIGGAVLIALLLQRRSTSRVDNDTTASWSATEEVRPLTAEEAGLPLVRLARWVIAVLIVGGLVAIPVFLRVDQVIKATAVVVFAVIGISLVVLTGWAGQISLGQVAFVGVGAAVGAKCTTEWNTDITIALLAAGLAGAASALVVGLPALRLRGLYLAVTTLAFAIAVTSWLLNDRFFDWVPTQRVQRLPLFGRIDISTPNRYYVFCLVVLAFVVIGVRGIRRSRTGRAIVAMRENERAAQSYAISATRVKLTAFIASGTIAGIAGGLFVHLSQAFDLSSYSAQESITVFTGGVVGGLGSITGAVLGAIYLRGTQWFITSSEWRILSSGVGVLFVLLVLPGGLGGLVNTLRERYVRYAARRGLTTHTDADLSDDAGADPGGSDVAAATEAQSAASAGGATAGAVGSDPVEVPT